METLQKDQSIIETLELLRNQFGDSLTVVDHWDMDLMAIGITTPTSRNRLVYFSTYKCAPGRYYVDLELPALSDSDLPYRQGDKFDDVDFATLVLILSQHLNLRTQQDGL